MTRAEQRALIRAYSSHLRDYLLGKLKDAPKEWDGRHLRNWYWMAAKWNFEFDMGRKEMKDLKNEIIVRNL